MAKISVKGFEDSLTKLEVIVDNMEKDDLPLEQALKNFKEGVDLIQKCEKAITESKQTVHGLIESLEAQKREQ